MLITTTSSAHIYVCPHSIVLARISKMPFLNCYIPKFLHTSCPDLASQLLQVLIPTAFNGILCQKGQFTLQPFPRRFLEEKIWL